MKVVCPGRASYVQSFSVFSVASGRLGLSPCRGLEYISRVHIVFDNLGTQVQIHRRLDIRLNTLLGAIHSEGWTYDFSRDPITAEQLQACNVLAIFTRHPVGFADANNPAVPGQSYAYDPSEISIIHDFVKAGGGLLLISNHGPSPTSTTDDTINDKVLAQEFNVVIKPARFHVPGVTLMSMTLANSLNSALSASSVLFQVSEIAVHNSCAIRRSSGHPFTSIATIPSSAVDENNGPGGTNLSPANHHYAIMFQSGSGRVIVAGNSGLAGDDGCTDPSPGTIAYANNLLFLLNCFKVLAGFTPSF